MTSSDPLLSIRNLTVEFDTPRGPLLANNRVSLDLAVGETLGIVGELGSGKSVLCRAVLRLLPSPPAHVQTDAILFQGRDLAALSNAQMRGVRGRDIAMVFQNPMSSLNPVWSIGNQIAESAMLHKGLGQSEARRTTVALLKRVGIPSAEVRVDDYPHQWSGGMIQRAVIAMAMAGEPKLLLADEPTTALDVTIQDQILSLLMELQRETGMAMMLVSHDMSVIAETCDRVAVMYAGYIVELAPMRQMFEAPRHPYTHGLLRSIPRVRSRSGRLQSISGQPPDLTRLGAGCPFVERCAVRSAECHTHPIALSAYGEGHATACLFPERMAELDRKAAS